MKAIPAIDLIDGKTVRLFQGDFLKETRYDRLPLDYARAIAAAGIEMLHLVDLSGAKQGKIVHTELLKEICSATSLKVDFGGGIQSEEDLKLVFDCGAEQAVIGSLCVKEPALVLSWIRKYGPERFVLALDTDGVYIMINGWQERAAQTIASVLNTFQEAAGISILTTDIRRDGTGNGPSFGLYEQLIQDYPQFRWIASGGVDAVADLEKLREIGCYGCVIGKALLDGKISLEQIKAFNHV